jgi:hypothetical protein
LVKQEVSYEIFFVIRRHWGDGSPLYFMYRWEELTVFLETVMGIKLYRSVLVAGLSFFLASCPVDYLQKPENTYTATIVWSADTQIVRFPEGLILEGDYIYL